MAARQQSKDMYAARHRPGVGGTGHALPLKATQSMLREQLADYVPSRTRQDEVIRLLMIEMHDPPNEVRIAMTAAVEGKHDATHMEVWRLMHARLSKLLFGVDLDEGGD